MNNNNEIFRKWHHSPTHVFLPGNMYIITAGTHKKEHFFKGSERLSFLEHTLLETTDKYSWEIQAWTVFSNHYHFIAKSPVDGALTLKRMIQKLHSITAIHINKLDNTKGRQVWFQYWDTCLTFEGSYYARLNYVHNNAVKHGLVEEADQYPYCSATWFKKYADQSFVSKVLNSKWDKVRIEDDY
ncbi:MAG: hypothetical protein GY855_05635 [candidate division Zixibacteria bacterium]|nr:hypothetical protein [candidate division Zixibacteria bacterium]